MAMDPIFLTIKDAATSLGTSRYTIYKLLKEGALAGQYHGNRRLVRVESLKAYADSLPTEKPKTKTGDAA